MTGTSDGEFDARNSMMMQDSQPTKSSGRFPSTGSGRSTACEYSYHSTWLGRPIIQYPQDVVALQEIIGAVKPGVVVETGIARGGSLMAAHWKIRVDGRDQFRLWGAFRSGRLPVVKLHFAREGLVEASVRLGRGVRHVRKVEWSAGDVVVHDRLEGSGSHRVESRLLWAPGAEERVELAVYGEGERRDEPAWVSERFGERVETRAAAVFTTHKLPADLGFRIRCLE